MEYAIKTSKAKKLWMLTTLFETLPEIGTEASSEPGLLTKYIQTYLHYHPCKELICLSDTLYPVAKHNVEKTKRKGEDEEKNLLRNVRE